MSILAHGLRAAAGNAGGNEFDFIGFNFDSTDATSYTFSSEAIGSPKENRVIALCIGSRSAGSTTVSSVTIGGVSATKQVEYRNLTSGTTLANIWTAEVPTGSTADIVVNFSGSVYRCGVGIYRIVGISSQVPYSSNGATANNVSINMNTPNVEAAVIAMCTTNADGSTTWTGLTEDCDFIMDGNRIMSTASDLSEIEETPKSISYNMSAELYSVSCGAVFSYGLDYEADFGTPDYTITTFPSTGAGVNSNNYDALIAIDATIGSANGLLMEAGGTGDGLAIGVDDDVLRVRGYDGSTAFTSIVDANTAYLEIDISAYTGTFCTYYFAFDGSNSRQLKAYVQVGGRGSANELVSLGTNSAASSSDSLYGGSGKGYGQVNINTAYLGTNYIANYTGTIDEIRYWAEDAALDVSTFGTL